MYLIYVDASGQVINPSKSTIYDGSITQHRFQNIANMLGFKIGTLPFMYLVVPIFRGKPITKYLKPITDNIKLKIAAWKTSSYPQQVEFISFKVLFKACFYTFF